LDGAHNLMEHGYIRDGVGEQPKHGVELIHFAVSGHPRMILGYARAVPKPGLAAVAGLGVNAGQINHGRASPAAGPADIASGWIGIGRPRNPAGSIYMVRTPDAREKTAPGAFLVFARHLEMPHAAG